MKLERLGKYSYPVFRIIIGLMFFTHGASKILGMFGGSTLSLTSQMGFVGLMEVLGGLAIAFGVFTRLVALGGVILMILIYYNAHLPKGILPMSNGGELAFLYFAAFLLILKEGAKEWSLEKLMFKKEIF